MTEAQKEAREALARYDEPHHPDTLDGENRVYALATALRALLDEASRTPQPTEGGADLPDPLQRIHWYSCDCDVRTKYCEEHHRRSITVGELLARRAPAEPAMTEFGELVTYQQMTGHPPRERQGIPAEPVACSCPSGDGSLRWPCQVHPPAEPAVTDEMVERAAIAWASGSATPNNWENMAPRLQGVTKDRMRAALRAALTTKEGQDR